MADICTWAGASGKKYEYEMHPIGTNWNDVPGNYIFAKVTSPNNWTAVYIGETESFKDRLPNHNELPCIRRNGGTHTHVHINRDSHASIQITLDTYSHVAPGLQQAAANRFDEIVLPVQVDREKERWR